MFIINEHATIMNVTRPAIPSNLEPYQPAVQKWMPKAEIHAPGKALARFDGVVTFRTAVGPIRYLVEEKRHLRHQDVGVIVEQLNRRRAELHRDQAGDRLLVLAPHVRPQQAAALERAEIDYLDLAGNAHLQAPGLFIHVEGRYPPKALKVIEKVALRQVAVLEPDDYKKQEELLRELELEGLQWESKYFEFLGQYREHLIEREIKKLLDLRAEEEMMLILLAASI